MITPVFSLRPVWILELEGSNDKHRTLEKMVETIAETIGIDISKAHLDVATHSGGEVKQFTNNAKARAQAR